MSISIHIPFYNPNPEKKEGYRNLRRFDYLEENVINLKTLSIKNDIILIQLIKYLIIMVQIFTMIMLTIQQK